MPINNKLNSIGHIAFQYPKYISVSQHKDTGLHKQNGVFPVFQEVHQEESLKLKCMQWLTKFVSSYWELLENVVHKGWNSWYYTTWQWKFINMSIWIHSTWLNFFSKGMCLWCKREFHSGRVSSTNYDLIFLKSMVRNFGIYPSQPVCQHKMHQLYWMFINMSNIWIHNTWLKFFSGGNMIWYKRAFHSGKASSTSYKPWPQFSQTSGEKLWNVTLLTMTSIFSNQWWETLKLNPLNPFVNKKGINCTRGL